MLYQLTTETQTAPRMRESAPPDTRPSRQSWQRRAVEAYQYVAREETAALPVELAARIASLTGQIVKPDAIYVDHEDRCAVATVEEVTFRLIRRRLHILRRCDACGAGQYESPPINNLADLGYALSTWQPPCQHCHAEEEPDWTDADF